MLLILQADDAGAIYGNAFYIVGAFQQALRLQFLAAKANHHHFAAEVWIEGQVMNGADRNDRCRSVNRHAAAIKMVQTHDAIDVGILRQQIAFDNFHYVIDDSRHAVHAGANTEQIFGANAAVGVAIAFEGIAFQRRQRRRNFGRQR